MAITAKVKCYRKVEEGGQTVVDFCADYEDGRNKEWAKYTPGLSLSMGLNEQAAEHFEQGKAYTLTFEPNAE